MENGIEAQTPKNLKELRAGVDGAWNKIRLNSMYLAFYAVYATSEYFENALAVVSSKDPAAYQAEKQQRHNQMVANLGEWAVERQIIT